MSEENNLQNINLSTSQATDTVQSRPTQIIHEKPKRNGRRVLFFTCGVFLLLLACLCSVFAVFSAYGGEINSITNTSSGDTGVVINEKTTGNFGDRSSFDTSKIAIVDVTGVINYSLNSEILPAGASNRTVIAQLNRAKDDSRVKAVIIRFNSGGGVVSAAEPICRAIKETNKSKPVYAFIDTEGASLAYLLPNCAKFIYARPDAITGSIGVRLDLLDLGGILERIGAKQSTITNTAGSKKTQKGLFEQNSDEYKQLQSMLDETYTYFLNKVWEGRRDKNNGLTFEKLKTYADGRLFSGLQAKQAGLVDETGYYEDVVDSVIRQEKLTSQNVQIVEYQQEENPFARLFGASTELFSLIQGNHVRTSKYQLVMIAD